MCTRAQYGHASSLRRYFLRSISLTSLSGTALGTRNFAFHSFMRVWVIPRSHCLVEEFPRMAEMYAFTLAGKHTSKQRSCVVRQRSGEKYRPVLNKCPAINTHCTNTKQADGWAELRLTGLRFRQSWTLSPVGKPWYLYCALCNCKAHSCTAYCCCVGGETSSNSPWPVADVPRACRYTRRCQDPLVPAQLDL